MNIIFGLFFFVYIILCSFLVLIILMQKGKSSMGFGHMGGTSQILFGGSGGQDILQKITWSLGAIFLFGSLGLAIIKSRQSKESRYVQPTVIEAPAKPAGQDNQPALPNK